jgi:hypothetical protein
LLTGTKVQILTPEEQCPNQDPRKDQCNGSGEGCELCVSENGYCKPTGGSISVSKIQGKGSLADYYYLNIMGEVGHPLHVVLRGSDGLYLST